MATAPEKLAALRHLLAARFPAVPRTASRVLPTGIPALDDAIGGLPLGAVTEIVCTAPSCGSHLFLGQLLAAAGATPTRVALVDGTDSFDPSSFAGDLLARLVWVRCHTTAEALQAVDLLARDANLGLLVLDLRRAPEIDLRRTPATQWYRLQRAVEPTDLALVVATPRASIPSAQVRLVLSLSHSVDALSHDRPALANQLAPALQRQRLQIASAG
ncbi:MAG: hypothetical protein HY736_10765 [Verrucomicrobia bacterium]|nr:hypothetical protein [Verrucomicrobiota bacterium]